MFAPTPITDSVALLAQIGHTLALLVFTGLVFSEVGILAGREPPRALRRVRTAAGAVAVALAPLVVSAEALRVSGREILGIVAPSLWAPAIWWQLAATGVVSIAGVVCAWAALVARRRTARSRVGASRVLAAVAVVAAAAAASVPVFLGHTQSIEPRWLIQAVDVVHLQVGAFWVGGTCALALCYRAERVGEHADRNGAARAALITARFSSIALVTVIVLVCAGGVLAVLILDRPGDITATGWGRILVIKTVLVLCVGVAAAWNRRRLLPFVTRHPDAGERWSALRTVVLIEAALLIVIVVISGLLANADPHGHSGMASAETLGVLVRS